MFSCRFVPEKRKTLSPQAETWLAESRIPPDLLFTETNLNGSEIALIDSKFNFYGQREKGEMSYEGKVCPSLLMQADNYRLDPENTVPILLV